MLKKHIYAFTAIASILGTFPAYTTVAEPASTIKNVIPDTTITTAIKSKYLADNNIKALNVHVETINGVVTLTGTVPNKTVKERAEALAREVNGVIEVISKLDYTDASKDVSTAVSDASITAALKSKYLTDDQIKSADIHVETVNGRVTLTGTVPNKDSKKRAETIARSTTGVIDVITKLTYTDQSKDVGTGISDATITAAIKGKYLADKRIKSLKIHVETVNGKVTLTGEVPNSSTKTNAEKIAKETEGVGEVINKLQLR